MTLIPERCNPEITDNLVEIGEVVKPHGIRGEVKVYSYSGQPDNFKRYKKVILQDAAGSRTRSYRVVKAREQGKLAILQLETVTTREDASLLLGKRVYVNKADFPKTAPDEYYWHQLEGLMVQTDAGQELGKVSRLFSTPAHDVMVVTGACQEYMIPVKGGIVVNVDVQEGKITVSPPAGLLEINK